MKREDQELVCSGLAWLSLLPCLRRFVVRDISNSVQCRLYFPTWKIYTRTEKMLRFQISKKLTEYYYRYQILCYQKYETFWNIFCTPLLDNTANLQSMSKASARAMMMIDDWRMWLSNYWSLHDYTSPTGGGWGGQASLWSLWYT